MIARELTGARRVPKRLQRQDWKASSFAFEDYHKLLRHVRKQGTTVMAKVHFNDAVHRTAFLDAHPTVKTLIINRDIHDIVVSAYHHHLRSGSLKPDTSFDAFFWKHRRPNGLSTAKRHARFLDTWAPADPRVFQTDFERLRSDPFSEVERLAAYLSVDATADDITAVIERHAFDNRQARSETGHMRKGIVGDHQSYFNDDMRQHLGHLKEFGRSER